MARFSEKKGPIGFVGWANAGSSRSTITWLSSAAIRCRGPHTPYRAIAISDPSCPSVIAPRLNNGIAGTSVASQLLLDREIADLRSVAVHD